MENILIKDQLPKSIDNEAENSPVIVIPNPSDSHLGYLNNSNVFSPFTLEDKRWITVEHYMLAKRFEGTVLEEQIRTSKNVYAARILAKPKTVLVEEDGRFFRKVVYGPEAFRCTALTGKEWESQREGCLDQALRAKFHQNKRSLARLLKTEGITIIDPKDPAVGVILERIRDEILEERTTTKRAAKRKFAAPYADLRHASLTEDERKLVNAFLNGVNILKIVENISGSQMTSDMLEDVFYNFLGGSLEDTIEILEVIKAWIREISSSWTSTTRNMPTYESIMREVEAIFRGVTATGVSETTTRSVGVAATRVKNSIFIATVIRWLRMDATSAERASFKTRPFDLKKENFVLPPLRRGYRSAIKFATSPDDAPSVPKETFRKIDDGSAVPKKPVPVDQPCLSKPKLPLTLEEKVIRGARYIELFRKTHKLSTDNFSIIVDHLEKMKRSVRKEWLDRIEKMEKSSAAIEITSILKSGRSKQSLNDQQT